MAVSRLGLFGVASRLGPVWPRGRWPSPGSGLGSWALALAWSGLGSWALALLECGVGVVLSAGYPLESHTRRASRGRGRALAEAGGRALAEAGGGPHPSPGRPGPGRARGSRPAGLDVLVSGGGRSPSAERPIKPLSSRAPA